MTLQLSTSLNGEQRQWPLETPPVRIGRASGNAVQLLDGTVSKEHAELTLDGEHWVVRDLGSRNGTRVNGREATSPLAVAAGDRLEIGHVLLSVSAAGDNSRTHFSTSEHVGSSLSLKVSDVLQRPTATGAGSDRLLHLLAEAGQLLVLPRPLPETCESLLEFVDKAVPARRLVILLRDAETGELQQMAARTRGGRANEPLALSQTITRTVLAENTAVITRDAASDPRFLAQHSIIAQAIHSAMAVPLFDNEKVLGILYVDSTNPAVTYGQPELELLTLLGNMAAVKITNARLLVAEQMRLRLAQELSTATRIQQNLLPEPPAVPGWKCHARIETCHEVGGDLYDFHLRDDGQLVVLVGDVSGKGMGAALLMSSTLSSARVLYDDCTSPLHLVRRLNAIMHRSTDSRSFVTVFVGWLEITQRARSATSTPGIPSRTSCARVRCARSRPPAYRSGCWRISRGPRARRCWSRANCWRCSATASPKRSTGWSSSSSNASRKRCARPSPRRTSRAPPIASWRASTRSRRASTGPTT